MSYQQSVSACVSCHQRVSADYGLILKNTFDNVKFRHRCPCQAKTNQGTLPLEVILQLYHGSDNTDKDTKGSFVLWPETVTWLLLTFVLGLNEPENPSNRMAMKSSI